MMKGQINEPKTALAFILAGKATVTLRSLVSGDHYTYKIVAADKPNPNAPRALQSDLNKTKTKPDTWFVKLLNGPDNTNSFVYIGIIRNNEFFWTAKSRVGREALSVLAITFVIKSLANGKIRDFEIWHEGRCGRCGHKLTVPESIATGFGPDCAQMVIALPLIQTSTTPVIDQPKGQTQNFLFDAVDTAKEVQADADDMVTIQGITMPISQADATAKALESLLEGEQGLDNVPEL
jgi:Family of unknown function (DUF6011)